ncbi:MAG: HD domain-containing protein [Phycisphaerales bacterium]|jgi:3'-5' exoribonuclease|nr:HD domain-containing protein [Phycisphaerales bacterium]
MARFEPGHTLHAERFLLVNPQLGTSRGGAPYLRCLLRNADGQVAGRCWSFDASRLEGLQRDPVVEVDGEVVEFQGAPQVNIETIDAVRVDAATMRGLLPTAPGDPVAMFREVCGLLQGLTDPGLRALAEAILDDEPLMQRFREAPAGVRKHHACIGGLMQHTLQIMRIVDAVVATYKGDDVHLNRDLVMLGAFLHDIGKTEELSWGGTFTYTRDGDLVGHIVRGAIMLEEKVAEAAMAGGEPLDGDLLLQLQHLILSHHERREYGAAKPPMTPEAHVLCMADRLDATLHLVD